MPNNYGTMSSMMGGSSSGVAPIPTQTFNSANILGTPLPMVGDNKGILPSGMIQGQNNKQLILVALAVIAIGYFAFHINFEK